MTVIHFFKMYIKSVIPVIDLSVKQFVSDFDLILLKNGCWAISYLNHFSKLREAFQISILNESRVDLVQLLFQTNFWLVSGII